MTDREVMIEVINGWVQSRIMYGESAVLPAALADRLIEAGFGRMTECLHGCSHIGDDVCFDPECPRAKETK